MNTYIYIRDTPFPTCKHCKKQLNFYVLGMDDSEHECDECWPKKAAERISDALMEIVKENLGLKE